MRHIALGLLIAAVLASGAYVVWQARSPTRDPGVRLRGLSPELPSVILIVVDTLRPDHTDPYGYDRPTVGALGELLAGATRYSNAYAPAGWTVPSTSSILTGLGPLRHGTRTKEARLSDELVSVAEVLNDAGLRTAAFSHNVHISPGGGFAQGFEHFIDYEGNATAYPHAEVLTEPVLDWLQEELDWPAFLYLQPMNCHGPYRVPEPHLADLLGAPPSRDFVYYSPTMRKLMFKGQIDKRAEYTPELLSSLRDQYDTAIRYTLDRMADILGALPPDYIDESLIIVTADHGEELFDHQGFSHAYSLHEEVVRVPLWVKLPGQRSGATVDDPVSLVDIFPTILAVTGLSVPHQLDGIPLPRQNRPGIADRPLLFDTAWSGRAVASGLKVGRYKLIHVESDYAGRKDATMLFDLRADPGEQTNLATEFPERVSAMHQQKQQLIAMQRKTATDAPAREELDEEVLRALGYVQ